MHSKFIVLICAGKSPLWNRRFHWVSMWDFGLAYSDWWYGQDAGCCENYINSSGSINCGHFFLTYCTSVSFLRRTGLHEVRRNLYWQSVLKWMWKSASYIHSVRLHETLHLYEVKRTWTVVRKAIKELEITSTSNSDICNWILWSTPVFRNEFRVDSATVYCVNWGTDESSESGT